MSTFLLMLVVNVFVEVNVFGRIMDESLLPFESRIEESSFIINTNQGRFAVNNTDVTMQSTIIPKTFLASRFSKNTTIVEMLGALRDATATLKKAWVRFTFPHVSLLMEFSDGRCEEMDWHPRNSISDVPGEHPAGQALLDYDVRNARCRNAPLLIGLPDSTNGVLNWLQKAIKLKSTQKEVDLFRWTPGHLQQGNQHVTRRQVYSAFFEEANRFKDEEKYSCSSFINNAFGIATGHRYVDSGTMVHLLKVGAQRFGTLSPTRRCKGWADECREDSECCDDRTCHHIGKFPFACF